MNGKWGTRIYKTKRVTSVFRVVYLSYLLYNEHVCETTRRVVMFIVYKVTTKGSLKRGEWGSTQSRFYTSKINWQKIKSQRINSRQKGLGRVPERICYHVSVSNFFYFCQIFFYFCFDNSSSPPFYNNKDVCGKD